MTRDDTCQFPHVDSAAAAARPLQQQVGVALHFAMMAHRQLIGRRLAEAGLHPGQAMCLREIAHSDGITQRDLAERLNVTRPTVTVMIKKMERAGLVERHVDQADQRFTHIHLTEKAARIHDDMHEAFGEIVDTMVKDISEEDQQRLVDLLGRMTQNMHAATEGTAR